MTNWQIVSFKSKFMHLLLKIRLGLIYCFKQFLLLVEFVLFLRLVLKFLNANPGSFAVAKLYWLTDFLVWPVSSIFPNFYLGGRFVDVVVITAMVGYVLIYLFILGVLKIIFPTKYL
jgi:hypothetical protein